MGGPQTVMPVCLEVRSLCYQLGDTVYRLGCAVEVWVLVRARAWREEMPSAPAVEGPAHGRCEVIRVAVQGPSHADAEGGVDFHFVSRPVTHAKQLLLVVGLRLEGALEPSQLAGRTEPVALRPPLFL